MDNYLNQSWQKRALSIYSTMYKLIEATNYMLVWTDIINMK